MGGMGHRLHDVGEAGCPPDALEIPLRSQSLDNDRGVDPLAGIVEVQQMAVEQLVRLVGEILRP